MRINEASFVVVDTETTGTKAATHRLIEVAAVKVRGGKVVDRFSQLVNPERSVPRHITRITGISTAQVFDQPTAAEVLPGFLDFLGDDVLVAHNLPFDVGFLNAELARAGLPPLTNPTLCTLRLARRLLHGLRSKGLTSVADFYGIKIANRHRALGDAEATATILLHFLKQLGFEHDVETLEDLLTFQHRRYAQVRKESKHLEKIREEVLPRLPARPGVYFMKDRQGTVLYIGKAKSLRDRVRSYFTAVEAHSERLRKLVAAVRDVTWEETGSELAALLLESKLIKQHLPRFNRAQRRYRNRPFLRLDTSEAYPRLSWTSYVMNDGAAYFGPLGGRRQAELVVELVNRFFRLRECDDDTFRHGKRCLYAEMERCDGPCEDPAVAARYDEEVQRVRAFLIGDGADVLADLEVSMQAAAAALDFEQAAQFRDWHRRLKRMLDRQQVIAASVLDHNAVLILPGVDATTQLFLIRYGRFVEMLTFPRQPSAEEVERLRDTLKLHFEEGGVTPDRYFKQEADEIRVLSHWMYTQRGSTRQVHWHPETDAAAFLEEILEQIEEARDEGEVISALDEAG